MNARAPMTQPQGSVTVNELEMIFPSIVLGCQSPSDVVRLIALTRWVTLSEKFTHEQVLAAWRMHS